MRRLTVIALLLLTALTAWAGQTARINFAHWEPSQWLYATQTALNASATMTQGSGYIENTIPPGSVEKDILSCKVGSSLMLLRGYHAENFVAKGTFAFDRKGAPGFILRAQRQGNVVGLAYVCCIYEKGVNLWRYDGKKWQKIGFALFPLQAGVFHTLRVQAEGQHFTVDVNGKRAITITDAGALPAGEAGVWLCEGPCRTGNFWIRPLLSK